ncbi:S41 family peptidase [Candidatus Saccharibacteria bacterium]|nr:S41 family peptidase [Candidatus Saccharibacteria bacterium]
MSKDLEKFSQFKSSDEKEKNKKMTNKPEWKEKRVSLGNAIIIGAVLAVFGAIVGINFPYWFPGVSQYFGVSGGSNNWSELDEVYNKLSGSYNGEIDKNVLIEGAKSGMVDALGDIYTVYMDKEESTSYVNTALHGNVGAGIGVEFGLRDGYMRVLRVLPDNPAIRAGVMIGDIIYKVNGEVVTASSTTELASVLRGDAGTEVTVTMIRDGEEKDFKMRREEINNVSVYDKYEGDTAIITVTRFDNDTGTEVQKIANGFSKKGINKVILDLRGNGGGYVSAAQDLLSLWLDNQVMLTQESTHFGEEKMTTSSGKAILKDMETVVLVNGSTASASEITAAALKEYGKAKIVGTTTYGKGVVQKMYDLSNGGMLKVTIAEWLTPKNNSINKTGVEPDVVVELTEEDINKMRDPQMDKAKSL